MKSIQRLASFSLLALAAGCSVAPSAGGDDVASEAASQASEALARARFAWTTPSTIASAIPGIARPGFAVNESGAAATAWLEVAQGETGPVVTLRASLRRPGGEWGAPSAITAPFVIQDPSVIPSPRIALDGEGNAIATWLTAALVDGKSEVTAHAARRLARGSAWLAAQTIFVTQQYSAGVIPYEPSTPPLAITPAGTAMVVWEEADGTQRSIKSSILSDCSGTWASPETVYSGAGGNGFFDALKPRLALDPRGSAIVTWGGSSGVFAAVRPANGAWSAPHTLTTTSVPLDGPQTGFDAQGNAAVVWQEMAVVHASVRIARTGAWQADETFETGSILPYSLKLAVGGNGSFAVAWSGYNLPTSDAPPAPPFTFVKIAERSMTAKTWGAPIIVSDSSPAGHPELGLTVDQPTIAYGSTGSLSVAWLYAEGQPNTSPTAFGIRAVTRPRAQGPFDAVDVVSRTELATPPGGDPSQQAGVAYFPQIATSREGAATVAWFISRPATEGMPLFDLDAASQCESRGNASFRCH